MSVAQLSRLVLSFIHWSSVKDVVHVCARVFVGTYVRARARGVCRLIVVCLYLVTLPHIPALLVSMTQRVLTSRVVSFFAGPHVVM